MITDFMRGETIWTRDGYVFSFKFHSAVYSTQSGRVLLRGHRHDNKQAVVRPLHDCAKNPYDLLTEDERV